MYFIKELLLLMVASSYLAQKDTHEWEGRNTIVHLFEWKWLDIAQECETFLNVKGFGGVQISPSNENIVVPNRPWWERYQPISYKIISRSGNEEQFAEMVSRCNKVGIRIYVDVVINHMARPSSNPIGVGGSIANPLTKDFPAVPYNASHFHDTCIVSDYSKEANVRNCELEGLKDLNQVKNLAEHTNNSVSYVRSQIIDFLNHLTSLGVAGFRIDAAKHMSPKDLKAIYSNLNTLNISFGFAPKSKPFIYQEVINIGEEAISTDEYTPLGVVTEFKYGNELGRVFRGYDKLANLHNWGAGWGMTPQGTDALVFIENHDNQRGHGAGGPNILTYKIPREYKMAIAFMLAHPYGITRIMSSYNFEDTDEGPPSDVSEDILSPVVNNFCQNGWVCEHRWPQIYNMISFKEAVKNTRLIRWWSNSDQQIAFSRGNKGFIVFNNGGIIDRYFDTGLPPGQYCDVINGGIENGKCLGKLVKVADQGFAKILLKEDDYDGVMAIHVNAVQTLL